MQISKRWPWIANSYKEVTQNWHYSQNLAPLNFQTTPTLHLHVPGSSSSLFCSCDTHDDYLLYAMDGHAHTPNDWVLVCDRSIRAFLATEILPAALLTKCSPATSKNRIIDTFTCMCNVTGWHDTQEHTKLHAFKLIRTCTILDTRIHAHTQCTHTQRTHTTHTHNTQHTHTISWLISKCTSSNFGGFARTQHCGTALSILKIILCKYKTMSWSENFKASNTYHTRKIYLRTSHTPFCNSWTCALRPAVVILRALWVRDCDTVALPLVTSWELSANEENQADTQNVHTYIHTILYNHWTQAAVVVLPTHVRVGKTTTSQ